MEEGAAGPQSTVMRRPGWKRARQGLVPGMAGARLLRCAARGFVLCVAVLATGCATVSFDVPRSESTYIRDTAQTELGRLATNWVDAHDGASGFYPLSDGAEALAARLGLAERAQKSIDLQYFLMKGDKAGLVIAKSLLMAADRGVRVRLLLDDVFTTASDRKLTLLDEHPNIEVRLFNPISRRGLTWLNFVFDFRRANRRMHNKSFSVDNVASIIGGRNIGEEYFDLKNGAVFVDFDVLAIGPIVTEVSESFDDFWNHSRALPIEYVARRKRDESLETYRATTGADIRSLYDDVYARVFQDDLLQEVFADRRPVFPAPASLIADSPDKLQERIGAEHQRLLNELRELLLGAEEELIFVSPYYVPLAGGVRFLRDVRSQGIDVIMITNSLASNNHIAVHSGYARYRRDVIRAGLQLHETRADAGRPISDPGDDAEQMTLHTKLIVVDRRYLVVGSPNMDPRSWEINAEKALIIDSEPLARAVAEGIHDALPETTYRVVESEFGRLEWHGRIDGRDVIETREPQASRWRRFKAWLLKIVPDRQL